MYFQYAQKYAAKVDATILYILQSCQMIDKVRVAMFITWLWALAGLYVTKAFEQFFRFLLKMPDSWLAAAAPTNSNGVKILTAHSGTADITNKFRLFLKYYWEKDDSSGGFSFASLNKLLNCSMLYCSYLLTDDKGTVPPEQFWTNVNRFLVEMNGDKILMHRSADLQNPEEVPFGTVRFIKKEKKKNLRALNDITRRDLLEFMESNNSDKSTSDLTKPPTVVSQIIEQFENR